MDRNHISDISKTNAHGLVGGETTATTSKSYKWLLVAMLSCAFFFHQADRALFGLLTIPIQKDLGLRASRMSRSAGSTLSSAGRSPAWRSSPDLSETVSRASG